jgi:hypothetical protein
MGKKLIPAAILGGIIVFVWGLFSWMVLPFHMQTMHKFSDEQSVADTIQKNSNSGSGVYVLPNMSVFSSDMSDDDIQEQMQEERDMLNNGPFMYAVVSKNGMMMGMPGAFVLGCIIQIIAAGLITFFVWDLKTRNFMGKVGYITLIGLIAGIIAILPNWLWAGFPISVVLLDMIDLVIGWFLGGLAIVRIIKK